MKAKITKDLIENLVEQGATYTKPKKDSLGVMVSELDLTTMKKDKVIDIWKVIDISNDVVTMINLTNNAVSKTGIGFCPGAHIGKIWEIERY